MYIYPLLNKRIVMITIEKLLLLKSVNLFKQMPDDLLLQVANTLTHQRILSPGEMVLEKGKVNSTMYVIVSGSVKVHDEHNRTIKELGPREIFGELSALTEQPTVSYVSAISECLLLTIRNDALFDLMSIELELSKGIIIALCERTQNMSFQIQELMHKSESNLSTLPSSSINK